MRFEIKCGTSENTIHQSFICMNAIVYVKQDKFCTQTSFE